MPTDGSGVYSLPAGYEAVTGETIQPSQHNPPLEDIAAALSERIDRSGKTAMLANIPFNDKKITGLGDATADTDALNRRTADARYLVASEDVPTECRLVKDGTDLRLNRFNGSRLTINGARVQIPSAGVTLSPSGLTPSTFYYIYAYVNSSVLTLEASITTPVVDSASGLKIKSGDATRTFVGVWVCETGPSWAPDGTAKIGGLSYFNRQQKTVVGRFAANRTVASGGAPAEVNSEIRVTFPSFGDIETTIEAMGGWQVTGFGTAYCSVAVDGALLSPLRQACTATATASALNARNDPIIAAGNHYATIFADMFGGTNVLFFGGGNGEVTLAVHVLG